MPAGGLAVGNAIVTRAGPSLIVQSIKWHRRAEGYAVYNFVVEDDHSYVVGAHNGEVWGHNGVGDCVPTSPTVLYRGVRRGHPAYADALNGDAFPGAATPRRPLTIMASPTVNSPRGLLILARR